MATSSSTDPIAERFIDRVADAMASHDLVKLTLGHYRGPQAGLQRVTMRPVQLVNGAQWSFVRRYATRDITDNATAAQALATVRALLADGFAHVRLQTRDKAFELRVSKKGQHTLRAVASEAGEPPPDSAHDRLKHHCVDVDRPWLQALGVTDAKHHVVPAFARKWKQINRFVEVLSGAIDASLLPKSQDRPWRVFDFGSGKGYLTFAVYDHIVHTRKLAAEVIGVELRQDMVDLCNQTAQRLGMTGLRFVQGDVASHAVQGVDVMIALHACDTATDHALHAGIAAGASVIMTAPCCHKEIRPQMTLPQALKPLLRHGIHLGQEAEMLTDSLRALLLNAYGYDAQVFEFVSLEHTSKNKMILATRQANPTARAAALSQVHDLKAFYGVREQCLERLLLERPPVS